MIFVPFVQWPKWYTRGSHRGCIKDADRNSTFKKNVQCFVIKALGLLINYSDSTKTNLIKTIQSIIHSL